MATAFELLSKQAVEAEALSYLRRESLDIYNRLHSIEEDVAFVNQVRLAYPGFAFLPNLRCGAWYTDPALCRKEPAYFKSTDGHFNGWNFNLRRPNVHLLPLAIEHGGLILVDSTRSGKRIPDALSKTIPIWCAVINRAVALRRQQVEDSLRDNSWDVQLYTPPAAVSSQEHAQIAVRLDQWANDLTSSSYTLPELSKPLRPFWITPANSTFPALTSEAEFLPVVCVSASRQVHDGLERRTLGFAYVQGSGDDHELWGMGLTPQLFWDHRAELLGAERSEVETLVRSIVSESHSRATVGPVEQNWRNSLVPIAKVAGRIQVGRLSDLPNSHVKRALPEDNTYILIHSSSSEASATDEPSGYIERLCVAPGKKGQHDFLRSVLPRAFAFASKHLTTEGKDVVVACEDGKDASIGVALALLQLFFDDIGQLREKPTRHTASKQSIRMRLEWIIAARPEANPSRTTLKRVNDFLLSPSSTG